VADTRQELQRMQRVIWWKTCAAATTAGSVQGAAKSMFQMNKPHFLHSTTFSITEPNVRKFNK